MLSKLSLINTVILLRSFSIFIQASLVVFVNVFLDYNLPWFALFIIIFLELLFNLGCYLFNKFKQYNQKLNLFIQLLADVIFLGCLLYFSGGATNSFVSLLLIPIAIAAVTLSARYLVMIATLALTTYSILLWLMPMSVMHGNMQGHFIGMWINFIFSAAVVSFVVGHMAKAITQREVTIAHYREEQLKQEKVIALGLASAQVTHDLATPLATIRLLTDELMEDIEENDTLAELDKQVERCSKNLDDFRSMSLEIKNEAKRLMAVSELLAQIQRHCSLNYPQSDIEFSVSTDDERNQQILSDSSLIPAILNIINNAIKASAKKQQLKVSLSCRCVDDKLVLAIRDYGAGFSLAQVKQLGHAPIDSEQGLGMAMFLSSASFERLGGTLALRNHRQGGAQVMIYLPLQNLS